MEPKEVSGPPNRSEKQVESEATTVVVAGEAELLKSIEHERADDVEAFILRMEDELQRSNLKAPRFNIPPKMFTGMMVAFASIGGLLFGIDQSVISGATLFMPKALGLDTQQTGFVSSGVPLGAIAGAAMLIPANEYLGRRRAIIFSLVLYTVGAVLEAGAINYPMMLIARLILGFGVGIETGTVPVYVAESVQRKYRGNLVSCYQMNIALGEVLGYVVAAIFLHVDGQWRYILGSSLLPSTIMFFG
ncbi:fructose symporter [Teratosphaeriaceae sp. CCFEE 6253]|nr:fructose symporter [Teratosphaeriaceae sp. CCFEE 6253]